MRAAIAILVESGRYALSSGGLYGTGVSGAVCRMTGASRDSKANSLIIEHISAPTPAVLRASWTTKARPVFWTEARIDDESSGESVRISMISQEIPSCCNDSEA